MIPIKNYVTEVLFNNKNEAPAILTYFDIYGYTEKDIHEYMMRIICKNPKLKQKIVKQNGSLYIDNIHDIMLEKYYEIIYTSESTFDNYIHILLNTKFITELQWYFKFYKDTITGKIRVYFKIDHAYADGYSIIKILTSGIDHQYNLPKINRVTCIFDTLYYNIFGFILMCIITLRYFINSFTQTRDTHLFNNTSSTDFIKLNPISLAEIKNISQTHKITVNDFLYSLLIKADALYNKENKLICTISSINISGVSDMNNVCPLYLNIKNTYDNQMLFDKVHIMFDSCKYSYFIPVFASLISIFVESIPTSVISYFYNHCMNTCNYTYSNIVGPSLNKITNIHFLTTAHSREVAYNIISHNDNVNIILTFKEGVIKDKKRFEECIYEAYNDLLKTNAHSS